MMPPSGALYAQIKSGTPSSPKSADDKAVGKAILACSASALCPFVIGKQIVTVAKIDRRGDARV